MRNIEEWQPSKVVKDGPGFRAVLHKDNSMSFYVRAVNLSFYVDYIREFAGGKLLDCGCGQVPYYEIYRESVDEIICTDWQNSLHGGRHVDVFSNLNEQLNFADGSFDTVLLTDVLEHIFKPENLLAEIARVLKPGGKVIIAVPFLYRIHEEPHDYYRYTEYSLVKLCDEAGLKVLRLQPFGGYLDILFDMMNKVIFRKPSMVKMFIPLAFLIKKSWVNRKINKGFGNNYPLGYILCAEKFKKLS